MVFNVLLSFRGLFPFCCFCRYCCCHFDGCSVFVVFVVVVVAVLVLVLVLNCVLVVAVVVAAAVVVVVLVVVVVCYRFAPLLISDRVLDSWASTPNTFYTHNLSKDSLFQNLSPCDLFQNPALHICFEL